MKRFIETIAIFAVCLFISACAQERQVQPRPVPHKQVVQEPQKKEPAIIPTGTDVNPETLQIPVLMYHSINENVKNNLITPPQEFDAQMKWLAENGYHPLFLSELDTLLLTGKNMPEKPIVITFDDGYLDNYTNAYPILKKYRLKANIFVITDKIAKKNHFDEVALKKMSDNGIEMQSHTVHHQELNTLSYNQQLTELKESKAVLQQLTGKTVNSICYPVGRYNEDTKRAAKAAGYTMGFTTQPGRANEKAGMYTLPRIRMVPGMSMKAALQ
ncbi:polysaccharide deacetylase family protein [Listeria riparia]|uniref:Exported polysaccharide deacetylase,lipoprotein n=1 Tax=Listeria riparia FSL S10-1204 TaxID=1265816 RepID=W7DNS7_9LIST|nr:polysaccharide deacetylase family protein [Listeria riparia]EUJ46958.1 exported polysaccharide deacetylase,lipoprotein [Listeria riparia FSL S10-1204]